MISKCNKQGRTRAAERTIVEVVKKVCIWRKLSSGMAQEDGSLVRYTFKDAAKKVEMSKKSLDDYLAHIKFGIAHGFDFKKRDHEKFGQLRSFNRQIKEQLKSSAL